MIPSPALSAWLSSRSAQRASQEQVEAFAGRWSHSALMNETTEQLNALPADDAAGVIAVARRFMDRVKDHRQLLSEMIAAAAAEPFFRPPFPPINSEIGTALLLFHNHKLSIALGVTSLELLAAKKGGPRGPASIGFTGHHMLMRYLKAGEAKVSLWEAPRIDATFSADTPSYCHPTGYRTLNDGDELLIDGHHQSFVIEHAASDLVYLQSMVRVDTAPLTAEYDSRSLKLIGVSSTDEISSRVQMLASLLRAMGRDDAAPLIAEFLDTPHFYTRWYLMREILAMDA